jgi:hypothetical protein
MYVFLLVSGRWVPRGMTKLTSMKPVRWLALPNPRLFPVCPCAEMLSQLGQPDQDQPRPGPATIGQFPIGAARVSSLFALESTRIQALPRKSPRQIERGTQRIGMFSETSMSIIRVSKRNSQDPIPLTNRYENATSTSIPTAVPWCHHRTGPVGISSMCRSGRAYPGHTGKKRASLSNDAHG